MGVDYMVAFVDLWTMFADIKAEASDIEAEMADPQDTIEEVPAPETSYTPAFTLETDGGLTKSSPVIWDVKIPEDAFIKFVRENDSTPGTMVELLMGKAINSLYPDRSKPIISSYVLHSKLVKISSRRCLTAAKDS